MTWSSGYTAFVVDAYAGVIAGWECSLTKDAAFVERALRHGLPDSPRSPVWRSYSSSRRRKSVYCNIFRQDTDASRAAAVDRHCWRRLDNALCETTTGPHRTECSHGSPFRSGPIRTLADLEDIASAWVEHTCHTQQGVRIPGRLQPA